MAGRFPKELGVLIPTKLGCYFWTERNDIFHNLELRAVQYELMKSCAFPQVLILGFIQFGSLNKHPKYPFKLYARLIH